MKRIIALFTETVEPQANTEAPAPQKKGCGSVVLGFPILFLTAGAVVLVSRKRKI